MQTLTSELLTAQQAAGQIPAMTGTAYNDVMTLTNVTMSRFTPLAHETLLASDSCIIIPTTSAIGKGVITVYATYNSSTDKYNFYYSFVNEANYNNASSWQTYSLLQSISTGSSYALCGISVTSDNYQNSTSDYFCLGINYMSGSGITITFNVSGNIWRLNNGSGPTSISSFSITDTTAPSSLMFSIFSFYTSSFINYGVSAHYDSVTTAGILFWEANYGQAGSSTSNYVLQGNFKLKYSTYNGFISGQGTDGTVYVLNYPIAGTTGRISTIYQNGIYYGAIQSYFQNTPGYTVRLFQLQGQTFSMQPFKVSGIQDITNATSSNIYGPQDVKLTLANLGFNSSNYPTLNQVFVLSYGYEANSINSIESLISTDFIHWGNLRDFTSGTITQFGLFNTTTNYLGLFDTQQYPSLWARSYTQTDISADIVTWDTNQNPDGSPSTLSLTLINNYVGSGVSNPNALIKDGLIWLEIGYNTTLGDEVVSQGWYYIDTISQPTQAGDNIITISCRDAFKHIQLATYSYQLQFDSQSQIIFNTSSDQDFANAFTQVNGAWVRNGSTVQQTIVSNNSTNLAAFNGSISPFFGAETDISFGSVAGAGMNMDIALGGGFAFDLYSTGDNTYPYQYVAVYLSNFVNTNGSNYTYSVYVYVSTGNRTGSSSSPAFSTSASMPAFNATGSLNLKVKRYGCYFSVYINNQLVSFPTFYTDLSLPAYKCAPLTGPNVYVFDNVQTNALITGQVSLLANYLAGAGPAGGSSSPQVTFSKPMLYDFNIVRANDYDLTDLGTLGNTSSIILPYQLNDTFVNLNNWQ